MIAFLDPEPAVAVLVVRRPYPRCGSTCLDCSTFLRSTRPLLPPKGTDPGRCGFSPCKPAVFRGPPERGHDRHRGPPGEPTP